MFLSTHTNRRLSLKKQTCYYFLSSSYYSYNVHNTIFTYLLQVIQLSFWHIKVRPISQQLLENKMFHVEQNPLI